jgi:hypothetical protein
MPPENINEKAPVLPYLSLPNIRHHLKGKIHPTKTPAVILGMAGATLIALPDAAAHLAGFSCWIIGNGLWVVTGISEKDYHLIAQFSFFFLTALMGAVMLLASGVI